jgi:hypothetical protein
MEKLGREVNTAELGGKKGGSHDLDEREAELGGKKVDPMTLMRERQSWGARGRIP